MAFYIYEIESTRIVKRPSKYARCTQDCFQTFGAAKAFMTRWAKGTQRAVNFDDFDPKKFQIAECCFFREHIEKKVTRKNMMSGKEYQEPINTPSYCSPSSEAYWSM